MSQTSRTKAAPIPKSDAQPRHLDAHAATTPDADGASHPVRRWQRSAGNHATSRLLARQETPADAASTTEPAAETAPAAPTDPIPLDGVTTFAPPAPVAAYLDAQGTADLPVQLGTIARGTLRIRKRRDRYDTVNARNRGNTQAIPLIHPALEPLRTAGVQPMLAVHINNGKLSGYATVARGERFVSRDTALLNAVKEHSAALGWLGLDIGRFPKTKNNLENGSLHLQVNEFQFSLGGYLDGTGTFGLENDQITFSADATVHVQGLTDAQLKLDRTAEGRLEGQIDVPVNLNKFSGSITARYENGVVDVRGTVGYSDEKFSGEVTLLVTDAATARNVALAQLGPEAVQAAAEQDTGEAARGGGRRGRRNERALAGWGTLAFSFTDWLSGRAQVIIDNEGHITVIGEITPQAEVELFPQRDIVYNIFTFEVRTLYGVPLVGNVFFFANIGMDALAKIGPGKLYNIAVRGRYSTDPQVFNEFSIEASLNISAFAGLRLRAEGGVGVEVVGHDIKAGVGVNALAGVRGYVEATPRIGYREEADPTEGRRGEFYLHGHMEIAAQPFLGMSGDLFVELDSPWWSPAPDKKWTWPLGELEYPLPGEFGIGADVDYVIGSGEVPEVQLGEVDFNKEKFMTDLINDHVPPKSQGEQEKQGDWQEDETTSAPTQPELTDSEGAPPADQPARGQQQPSEGEPPAPDAMERWGEGMQALGALAEQSQRDAFTQAELEPELARIRQQFGFSTLRAERIGEDWGVTAAMNPTKKKTDPPTIEGETAEEDGSTADAAQAKATPLANIPALSSGDLVRIHTGRKWAIGDFLRFHTLTGTQLIEVQVGNAKYSKPISTYNQDRGWKQYNRGATTINYGTLDPLGRPTGIRATLGLPLPEGSRASATPPGFGGASAGHARGHLLAKQLGGSGRDSRNIVTLFQTPVNTPTMSGYEAQVRQAVEDGQIVTYNVTPVYSGNEPMPTGITILATGDGGYSLSISIPNRI